VNGRGASRPVGQLVQKLAGFLELFRHLVSRTMPGGPVESNASCPVLQPKGAMQTDFKKMLVAWSKGDVTAIARAFNHDLQASPDLRDALIRRRNANWAKWIEQRMDKPGSILVAVGAGHLAGRYSVIDLLQRGGYKVTRLQ